MEDYLAAVVRANRAIEDAARGKGDVACARRCRRISASGGRRWNSCSAPSAAARISTKFRRWIWPRRRARHRCVLPPGLRRAAGKARRRHSGAARHAGDARRHHRPRNTVEIDDRARAHQRARRDRHGVDQRARVGPDQVRRRPAEAPHRRAREALARQLRSRRAGAEGQSARTAARRSGVREGDRPAHRGAARQCRGTPLSMVEIAGKFGRELAAQGEAAMVDFAAGLAGRPVRRRREEGGRQRTQTTHGATSPGRSARSRRRRPAARARAAS